LRDFSITYCFHFGSQFFLKFGLKAAIGIGCGTSFANLQKQLVEDPEQEATTSPPEKIAVRARCLPAE